MANDKPSLTLTHEQLQELLAGVLAKANQMNPLEQQQYAQQQEEKRRIEIFKNTVRSEVEAQKARLMSCSHSRWPATAGKLGGHAAPKGAPGSEWTTGGQQVGRDRIGLACLRCSKSWVWHATPQELEYCESNGLLNYPPPPEERCLAACRHCAQFYTNKELAQHETQCKAKYTPDPVAMEAMRGTIGA